MITVEGDHLSDNGQCLQESLELFDGDIAYGPERVFTDEDATIRRYDEMWTADWWWNTQVRAHSRTS